MSLLRAGRLPVTARRARESSQSRQRMSAAGSAGPAARVAAATELIHERWRQLYVQSMLDHGAGRRQAARTPRASHVTQMRTAHRRFLVTQAAAQIRAYRHYAAAASTQPALAHPLCHAHVPTLVAHIAATRIAAAFRGWRTRQWHCIAARRPSRSSVDERFAAFTRGGALPMTAATLLVFHALQLQAWWRMVRVRWYYKRYRFAMQPVVHAAACSLQRAVRKWLHGRSHTVTGPGGKRTPGQIIQRAWRAYKHKQAFRQVRELLRFRNAGDPAAMLASICPTEAALLDSAVGASMRFRLGVAPLAYSLPGLSAAGAIERIARRRAAELPSGSSDVAHRPHALAGAAQWPDEEDATVHAAYWPPTVYFKVYISSPLCDINAFAPRRYSSPASTPPRRGTMAVSSGLVPVAGVKNDASPPSLSGGGGGGAFAIRVGNSLFGAHMAGSDVAASPASPPPFPGVAAADSFAHRQATVHALPRVTLLNTATALLEGASHPIIMSQSQAGCFTPTMTRASGSAQPTAPLVTPPAARQSPAGSSRVLSSTARLSLSAPASPTSPPAWLGVTEGLLEASAVSGGRLEGMGSLTAFALSEPCALSRSHPTSTRHSSSTPAGHNDDRPSWRGRSRGVDDLSPASSIVSGACKLQVELTRGLKRKPATPAATPPVKTPHPIPCTPPLTEHARHAHVITATSHRAHMPVSIAGDGQHSCTPPWASPTGASAALFLTTDAAAGVDDKRDSARDATISVVSPPARPALNDAAGVPIAGRCVTATPCMDDHAAAWHVTIPLRTQLMLSPVGCKAPSASTTPDEAARCSSDVMPPVREGFGVPASPRSMTTTAFIENVQAARRRHQAKPAAPSPPRVPLALLLSGGDTLASPSWYCRDDAALNGWRPVATDALLAAGEGGNPALRLRRRLAEEYRPPPTLTPQQRAAAAKQARRRWMMSLYTAGLASEGCDSSAAAAGSASVDACPGAAVQPAVPSSSSPSSDNACTVVAVRTLRPTGDAVSYSSYRRAWSSIATSERGGGAAGAAQTARR